MNPHDNIPFQRYAVIRREAETETVHSFYLRKADGTGAPAFRAGQHVLARIPGGERACPYSLSDRPGAEVLRITVKLNRGGGSRCSSAVHLAGDPGQVLEISEPQGEFTAGPDDQTPLVLVSAGVGVTPMMAILADETFRRTDRPIFFIHGARNGREIVFGTAMRQAAGKANVRLHVAYSQPRAEDRAGIDFHSEGRVTGELVRQVTGGVAGRYLLCGPGPFLDAVAKGLRQAGVSAGQMQMESFGAAIPGMGATGPADVCFRRSGVTAAWKGEYASLLEMAEDLGLQPDYYCRAGICHTCELAMLLGEVEYTLPVPNPPAPGRVLICCARPKGELILDL